MAWYASGTRDGLDLLFRHALPLVNALAPNSQRFRK